MGCQSVVGFGGKLCYLGSPGVVMADGETKKFKRQPLSVANHGIDGWICSMLLPELHVKTVRFSMIEGHEGPDQHLEISTSAESDAAATCLSVRCGYYTTQCGII